jgi:hypothetical protein
MVCRRWPVGTYSTSLEAGMVFVMGFVGRTVQPAFPEGRLVGVAMVGPVRRPPERRYSSIDDIKIINVFIDLC